MSSIARAWTRPTAPATDAAPLIVLLNKPFGVLCHFTDADGRPTLAGLVPTPGIYAAGRLDHDSEGLLVLTDDGVLAHRLTDPANKQAKTYRVQVDGDPDRRALAALRHGVTLKDGPTLPAQVRRTEAPDWLWPRDPPVRLRQTIPTTWLELVIREGRNRQVRRMTAAVGHPTLRLIRTAIGDFRLDGLRPGEYRIVDATPAPPREAARHGPHRHPAARGRPSRPRR